MQLKPDGAHTGQDAGYIQHDTPDLFCKYAGFNSASDSCRIMEWVYCGQITTKGQYCTSFFFPAEQQVAHTADIFSVWIN